MPTKIKVSPRAYVKSIDQYYEMFGYDQTSATPFQFNGKPYVSLGFGKSADVFSAENFMKAMTAAKKSEKAGDSMPEAAFEQTLRRVTTKTVKDAAPTVTAKGLVKWGIGTDPSEAFKGAEHWGRVRLVNPTPKSSTLKIDVEFEDNKPDAFRVLVSGTVAKIPIRAKTQVFRLFGKPATWNKVYDGLQGKVHRTDGSGRSVSSLSNRKVIDAVFSKLQEMGLAEDLSRGAARGRNPTAKYAYHVTYFNRLGDIAEKGLSPKASGAMGVGGYAGHSSGRLFLSDAGGVDYWYEKAENAANDSSDDPLEEGFTPVVLRMPMPKTKHEDEPGSTDSLHDAWYVTKRIAVGWKTKKTGHIEAWNGSAWIKMWDWETIDPRQAYQDDDGEEGTYFRYQDDNPLAQIRSPNPTRKARARTAARKTGKQIKSGAKTAGRAIVGAAKGAVRGAKRGAKSNPVDGCNLKPATRPKGVSDATIEAGVKVELEHTTDRKVARTIAYHHLHEDPAYYRKLARIENPVTEEQRRRMQPKSFAIPKQKKYAINSGPRANYALTLLNQHYRQGARTRAEYITAFVNIMNAFRKYRKVAKRPPLVRTEKTLAAYQKAKAMPNPTTTKTTTKPRVQLRKGTILMPRGKHRIGFHPNLAEVVVSSKAGRVTFGPLHPEWYRRAVGKGLPITTSRKGLLDAYVVVDEKAIEAFRKNANKAAREFLEFAEEDDKQGHKQAAADRRMVARDIMAKYGKKNPTTKKRVVKKAAKKRVVKKAAKKRVVKKAAKKRVVSRRLKSATNRPAALKALRAAWVTQYKSAYTGGKASEAKVIKISNRICSAMTKSLDAGATYKQIDAAMDAALKEARSKAKLRSKNPITEADVKRAVSDAKKRMSVIKAVSFERYNGGVKIKRLFGSSTVTKFFVSIDGVPNSQRTVEGYGKTPGERKTYAKRAYEMQMYNQVIAAVAKAAKATKAPAATKKTAKVPKASIDYIVGNIHVGTPEAEVRAEIEKRVRKAKGTEKVIKASGDYAVKSHLKNRKLYNQVMSGRLGNPTKKRVVKKTAKKRVVKKTAKKRVVGHAPRKEVVRRKKYYVVWNKLRTIGSSVRPDPKIKVGSYSAKVEERSGLVVSSPTKTQTAGRKNLQVFDTKREADSFVRRLTAPSLKKAGAPKKRAAKKATKKRVVKKTGATKKRVVKKTAKKRVVKKTAKKATKKRVVRKTAKKATPKKRVVKKTAKKATKKRVVKKFTYDLFTYKSKDANKFRRGGWEDFVNGKGRKSSVIGLSEEPSIRKHVLEGYDLAKKKGKNATMANCPWTILGGKRVVKKTGATKKRVVKKTGATKKRVVKKTAKKAAPKRVFFLGYTYKPTFKVSGVSKVKPTGYETVRKFYTKADAEAYKQAVRGVAAERKRFEKADSRNKRVARTSNPSKDVLHISTRSRTRGGKKVTLYYVLLGRDWVQVNSRFAKAALKASAVKVPWTHGQLPHHKPTEKIADRELGLMMHNWHASMGDPIYGAGSLLFAGKRVPAGVMAKALSAVRSLRASTWRARNKELLLIERNLEERVGVRRAMGAAKAGRKSNPARKAPKAKRYLLNGKPVSITKFFKDNDLDPDEVKAIRSLKPGQKYQGGGGAWATWSIERKSNPSKIRHWGSWTKVREALHSVPNAPTNYALTVQNVKQIGEYADWEGRWAESGWAPGTKEYNSLPAMIKAQPKSFLGDISEYYGDDYYPRANPKHKAKGKTAKATKRKCNCTKTKKRVTKKRASNPARKQPVSAYGLRLQVEASPTQVDVYHPSGTIVSLNRKTGRYTTRQKALVSAKSLQSMKKVAHAYGGSDESKKAIAKGEKIKAVKIELHRMEGVEDKAVVNAPNVWLKANQTLARWAVTAPAPMAHDRTDFTITFQDGEKYPGRYDLSQKDMTRANLGEHVRRYVSMCAGINNPGNTSDAEYKAWLKGMKIDTKAYAKFLKTYDLG